MQSCLEERNGSMLSRIIRADKDMLQELLAIEKRCFSDPWSEKSLDEELTHPQAYCLVAEGPTGLLGYIFLRDICGTAELMRIAVDPPYRGLGVGRALLEAGFTLCQKEGLCLVNLEVEEDNVPAIRLYESAGFERVGRRKGYYGDKAAILMTKEF